MSILVPSPDRRRWIAEWDAELHALERTPRGRGVPSALAMCAGALAQSLWQRKEWTLGLILQDVRYALRVLARSPGFAVLAIVTMALGIGANTIIFSMTNATLLRPPDAIDEPAGVVQIGRDRADEGFDNLSYAWFRELRGEIGGLNALAAYTSRSLLISRGAEVAVVPGTLVTGEYFDLLGVEASRGRVLRYPDDSPAEAPQVAVISHGLWSRRYGEADVIGDSVHINGTPFEIIGVAEPGFRGTDVVAASTDVWVPLATAGVVLGPEYLEYDDHRFSWLWLVGRLSVDTAPETLAAELNAYYRPRFEEIWGQPADDPLGVVAGVGLRPGERAILGSLMSLLTLVVVVVLTVACANLANLLLARGIARSRELAVRTALGAGRSRLVRQMLTESVLLALAGGLLAFVLTYSTAGLIPGLLPISLGVSFRPDLTVFAFAAAVSLMAAIIFGIAPALRASRAYGGEALRERSTLGGRRGGWLRNTLVVAQLALSFALLATTGLFVQSLVRASSADPGYNVRDILTMTVDVDMVGADRERGVMFFDELRARASALPGVEAVSLGSNLPFAGWRRESVHYPVPPPEPERPFVELDAAVVDENYFATLEIALLAGEPFSAANAGAAMPGVVMLSESAARLLYPSESAVGKLLPRSEVRTPEESLRVVGIVADVQTRSLREPPRPSMYLPDTQDYFAARTLFLRAATDPGALAAPLKSLVAGIDGDLGILQIATLHERMGRSLTDTVLVARLGGLFGLLAVVLAAVGLYGVISYVASSRTHEVGVRMALGARRATVVGMFVGQALRFTALGVAAGLLLTLAAGGVVSSFLYGTSPRDPATLAIIGLGVCVVALSAAIAPAWRATRIEPSIALRRD